MNINNVNSSFSDALPRWISWLTVFGVGGVMMLVVIGVLIIKRGAADPPVAGSVIWSDTAFDWLKAGDAPLLPGASSWWMAPEPAALAQEGFTVNVTARFSAASDPSAAWGIWLEQIDGTRVIYAISGKQYTTTRVCDVAAWSTPSVYPLEECPALHPEWAWNWYVRLNPAGETNLLTLHREASGEVRLRINRENLGAAEVAYTGRWGVWLRGGRAGGASLFWERAEVYALVHETVPNG